MVGDKNQLPPVGAGNVLADLIKSNLIGVVSLDKIFRQAMKSKIVSNAHRVVNGEMPVFDNSPDSDFSCFVKIQNISLQEKLWIW